MIVVGFIERLFRRKARGWMSMADYCKHHEREFKRNPLRFEQEQEQARRWSMCASRNRKEDGGEREEIR